MLLDGAVTGLEHASHGGLFAAAFVLAPKLGAVGIAGGVLLYSLVMAVLLALLLMRVVRGDRVRRAGG